MLHWPASPLEERAGVPALASATRPSVSLLTPQSQLRASSVTCSSACRSYSPPSSGWPTGSLHLKRHSMRSANTKPVRRLRVSVPGARSYLAPHPDRSHQGSPISPRRITGAEYATPPSRHLLTHMPRRRLRSAHPGLRSKGDILLTNSRIERCLFLRADDLPGSSYCRPRSNRRTPPQPSLHALEIHNWNAVFNPSGSRRVPR